LQVDARGVATVTLDRPEVNNAYDGELVEALSQAIGNCASDGAARVVVIRGAGRHFQAGADLRWIERVRSASAQENLDVSRGTARAARDLNELPKPTIALVHGGCFGGGVGLVAACDVVIASAEAIFAISEARWGLMAGIILPQLDAAIGVRQVRRYALTCERFDAERAQAMGLVHEVCPTGGLDEAAAPVIEALLACAPGAIAETKRVALREAGCEVDDARLERLVEEHAAARQAEEAGEGLASFAEKRPAAWQPVARGGR
jgi:methylglutaconyl-CoA hydratase